MNLISKQRGMSVLTLIFVLILAAFALLIGLKLIPIYLESYKIDKAMKGVIEQRDIGDRSKEEILIALSRRLDIDSVTTITEKSFKDYGKIVKKGSQVSIEINYEKVVPVVGNLSLLAEFDKRVANY